MISVKRSTEAPTVLNFRQPLNAERGPRAGKPAGRQQRARAAVDYTAGAKGSGGPPGERNGQYRHGERTKAVIAEQQKFSALLKMLRAGLK